MVSGSSFEKSAKKAFEKNSSSDPSESVNTNTSEGVSAIDSVNFNANRLPPSEEIQLLFPKCKPRNEYQHQSSKTASKEDTSFSTNSVSIAFPSSSSTIRSFNTRENNSANYFNMNSGKLMKPQISKTDHKKQYLHQTQFFDQTRHLQKSTNSKNELSENYAETNPFRIESNNQYFYTPTDMLFDNNNSATTPSDDKSMHHYPSLIQRNYQMALDDRRYFLEPDEIEHNPYMLDTMTGSMNTIPSSILKTSPPATPPALKTSPAGSSPIESNRNIWDLSPIKSPIKSNTPTKIKMASATSGPFSRTHRGSYKKLIASPHSIEEDLETGHFYYNNKKTYFQAPQTDSDSNEPVTVIDEVEKLKLESKIKHSESSDYIYAEVRKNADRKIVKSKSGSGIMEYDGSPRRFGSSSNEEFDGYTMSSNKIKVLPQKAQSNVSSASPPRPGFPQRVVTCHKYLDSQIETQKPLRLIDPTPANSQLIPTTFINNNSYESTQTIQEERDDDIYKGQSFESNTFLQERTENKQHLSGNDTTFQVTSPTEEYIPTSTFDYLYEFSETRKVLEEFFKCPDNDQMKELEKFSDLNESDDSLDIQYDYREQIEKEMEKLYQQQLIPLTNQERDIDDDNRDDKDDDAEEEAYLKAKQNRQPVNPVEDKSKQFGFFVDSASRSSLGDENVESSLDNLGNKRMSKSLTNNNYFRTQSKNFNYSPDTTDYDSNYGDFDFESESPLRFLSQDYSNTQTYNNNTATQHSTTLPSATVDLSGGPINNYARYCTSMPVLEDGLSSGHASDNENNNQIASAVDIISLNKCKNYASSISTIQKQYQETVVQNQTTCQVNSNGNKFNHGINNLNKNLKNNEGDFRMRQTQSPPNSHPYLSRNEDINAVNSTDTSGKCFKIRELEESFCTMNALQHTPPPPAPVPHRQTIIDAKIISPVKHDNIHSALNDIRTSLQNTKINNPESSPCTLYGNNKYNNDYYDRLSVIEKVCSPTTSLSPVWIPRTRDKTGLSPIHSESGPLISKSKNKQDEDEEEIDTDLETDRLLGHKITSDEFYDEKSWTESKTLKPLHSSAATSKISPKTNSHASVSKLSSSTFMRHGLNVLLPLSSSSDCCINSPSMLTTASNFHQSRSLKTSPALITQNSPSVDVLSLRQNEKISPGKNHNLKDQQKEEPLSQNISETIDLCNLEGEVVDSPGGSSCDDKSKKESALAEDKKKRNKNKEVLIEGVLFRARYLGSTQLVCEGQPTKSTRMMQAEEAVSRIKALAPDGENQPSTEVDLFISTEKIMVLNTDLKEIMMDHALRTISYIADIGDLVVLMARRRFVPQDVEANSDSGTGTGGSGNVSGGSGGPTPPTSGKINRTPKMICHVFESSDASYIASSIGTAFQVAYMEFLKANGIEDHSFMKEMDYQEVLNSQEIFGDELEIFAKKELQKEVVVPKAKGEILGVVIVESGWGSMLPTVVIANLASNGAAARCGQLNIGDQIIAINGLSLVGLPLSQCQTYIKNTKNQTVVKFTVVPCAPVVEVKIKRPNTKYQLGFSVQNGVICSLLRGGIAERGGVRVGHRIIEINNQSVVAVPHEKIVNLLATSVGEILMKTMPTSMFRLLTGQENPIYI